jgi:hypothetical protein
MRIRRNRARQYRCGFFSPSDRSNFIRRKPLQPRSSLRLDCALRFCCLDPHSPGRGRSIQNMKPGRCAAGLVQEAQIALHLFLPRQPRQRLTQNAGRACMCRGHDLVMHPFALAPCLDNAGSSQIGKVSRDLWLALLQDLHEVANAYLPSIHQVQKPQACSIG